MLLIFLSNWTSTDGKHDYFTTYPNLWKQNMVYVSIPWQFTMQSDYHILELYIALGSVFTHGHPQDSFDQRKREIPHNSNRSVVASE